MQGSVRLDARIFCPFFGMRSYIGRHVQEQDADNHAHALAVPELRVVAGVRLQDVLQRLLAVSVAGSRRQDNKEVNCNPRCVQVGRPPSTVP